MKVKLRKTAWMRPSAMARLLGTSNQNINNLRTRGLIEQKVDRYGVRLVKGR